MPESVLPMFFSRSFIVSGLTFRSLIHKMVIFMNVNFTLIKKVKWTPTIWQVDRQPRETKAYVHCTQMFTAALSVIAKNYKQPKSPSTDNW